MSNCNKIPCSKNTKDKENDFPWMIQRKTTQMMPMWDDQGKKKRNVISNMGNTM